VHIINYVYDNTSKALQIKGKNLNEVERQYVVSIIYTAAKVKLPIPVAEPSRAKSVADLLLWLRVRIHPKNMDVCLA
jgi:hypothetical protein